MGQMAWKVESRMWNVTTTGQRSTAVNEHRDSPRRTQGARRKMPTDHTNPHGWERERCRQDRRIVCETCEPLRDHARCAVRLVQASLPRRPTRRACACTAGVRRAPGAPSQVVAYDGRWMGTVSLAVRVLCVGGAGHLRRPCLLREHALTQTGAPRGQVAVREEKGFTTEGTENTEGGSL